MNMKGRRMTLANTRQTQEAVRESEAFEQPLERQASSGLHVSGPSYIGPDQVNYGRTQGVVMASIEEKNERPSGREAGNASTLYKKRSGHPSMLGMAAEGMREAKGADTALVASAEQPAGAEGARGRGFAHVELA